jgi:hypothetical protein
MSQKFYQVMISSELRTQGLRLLERLIAKRLIFGGPVFNGPARFLWKNEIVEHDYCWTITFTPQDLRDELIKEAEKESAEADLHDHVLAVRRKPGDASAPRGSVPRTREGDEAGSLTRTRSLR